METEIRTPDYQRRFLNIHVREETRSVRAETVDVYHWLSSSRTPRGWHLPEIKKQSMYNSSKNSEKRKLRNTFPSKNTGVRLLKGS